MKISKVWVVETHVYAETENGIRASYAFTDWPRLANASEAERQDFQAQIFYHSCLELKS